jgi:dihydrofolate reductase
MRTLIVSEFVTLDGVMEAPGGEPTHPHTGWVFDYEAQEQIAWKEAEVAAAGTLLIGRVTYESFAPAWQTYQGSFADPMNGMQKVVVSSTLTDPDWNNTTVLSGDVVRGVQDLKAGDGGPILVHGSATLAHTLFEHDLVDEVRLMVFPVTIGAGLRVFPDTRAKRVWREIASETFPSGVRVTTLRRA